MSSPSSIFEAIAPPCIGTVRRSYGTTCQSARSGARFGAGFLAVVALVLVGLGVEFVLPSVIRGFRSDTLEGLVVALGVGLPLAALVFWLRYRSADISERVTFLGDHGIAYVAGGRAPSLVRIVMFDQIGYYKLEQLRHGKNGINLRKRWILMGHDRRILHVLSGDGRMNRMSADVSRATPTDGGWAFAEAVLAGWTQRRNAFHLPSSAA